MASSAACCCCCASSQSQGQGLFLYRSSLSTSRPARVRLVYPASAPAPRLSFSSRTLASPDSPPLAADDRDDAIGFEIQVSKMGKRNRRVVRARVRVDAPLEAVWATLTDYEGLAEFIPGLAECRLLDRAQGFARIYQVGEQDLALGFKFNAKGTIDCYEGDMMESEAAGARRREIAFNMIDGDFKVFQGKWSVLQEHHHHHTTLSYMVELEPKLWVPVSLLEGRICTEIKNNLVSIREQAQQQQLAPGNNNLII